MKKKKIKLSSLTQAQQIVKGIQILLTYDSNLDVSAGHDEIYVGSEKASRANVSEKDRARLRRCGFSWDKGTDSWQRFA